MWRDIILVIGFALTVMLFWGLDANKIATVIKGYGVRNAVLVGVSVTVTLLAIYVGFYLPLRKGSFSNIWGFSMALMWLCLLVWKPMLTHYLSDKPKLTKVVSLIELYGFLPALAVLFIQSDTPFLYDLAFAAGGLLIGAAAGYFTEWIQKRRREKMKSGE